MSRLAKNPIEILAGVTVAVSGDTVTVTGPKGTLTKTFRPEILVEVVDNTIVLTKKGENVFIRSLWGTVGSHLRNMMEGVTKGFEKKLILEGVGFKSAVVGTSSRSWHLDFHIQLKFQIPEGLDHHCRKKHY
jgi:large subunit ribosomal protein L6